MLGFMSSWDRQTILDRYKSLFDAEDDPTALLEELGTPTRLAIDLARTYVPSAAPVSNGRENVFSEDIPEQTFLDLEPVKEETSIEHNREAIVKKGALIAYMIPAILIGLPVLILLICIGLIIAGLGAALGVFVVNSALVLIAQLGLVSDILLTVGVGLVLMTVALLLLWLGIWLGFSLCRLWVSGILVKLGRKLCIKKKKEAA